MALNGWPPGHPDKKNRKKDQASLFPLDVSVSPWHKGFHLYGMIQMRTEANEENEGWGGEELILCPVRSQTKWFADC
jgi:hypothetical protein